MDNAFDIFALSVESENDETDIHNPNLHLLDLNPGDTFTANGIEFIRLGFEQGGILCVTKNSVFTSKFDERDGENNYRNSIVRRKIEAEFLPRLEGIELLPYEIDLTAMNGETDYGSVTDMSGLLTFDLYRKYHYQIPTGGREMWLCTAFACLENFRYVNYVHSSGNVSSSGACNAFRCRPACVFAI